MESIKVSISDLERLTLVLSSIKKHEGLGLDRSHGCIHCFDMAVSGLEIVRRIKKQKPLSISQGK